MLKKIFSFYKMLFLFLPVYAQHKSVIDTGMLGTWPYINGDAAISYDGRYTAFTINSQPVGANTLVIRDLQGKWMQEHISANIGYDFYFTKDGKKICWQSGDSLFLQIVEKQNSVFLGIVDLYRYPRFNKGNWLAYKEKGVENGLVVMNLLKNKTTIFYKVQDFLFDDYGHTLLLRRQDEMGNSVIQVIELDDFNSTEIWSGNINTIVSNYQFDRSGKQLAFMVTESSESKIYYYKQGMIKAVEQFNNKNEHFKKGFYINGVNGFTHNGKWLFVKLKKSKPKGLDPNPEMVSVDVWSYRDELLNPMQAFHEKENSFYDLVLHVGGNNEAILLNPDGVKCQRPTEITGDYCILSSDTIAEREFWWPHAKRPTEWLVSLKDGSRRIFMMERGSIRWLAFSPNGKWITWWDLEKGAWMSLEVATGTTNNMGLKVPTSFVSDAEYLASSLNYPVDKIAGWCENDSFAFLYDNYDIWKVDPTNRTEPVNITNGLGIQNSVEIRIIDDDDISQNVFKDLDDLMMVGFKRDSKYNGFLRMTLGKKRELQIINLSPQTFYRQSSQAFPAGMKPIKSLNKGKKVWIVMRQSATECPNYFYTMDFKQFSPLTSLAPQRNYNWLASELVNWRFPDGRIGQAVLYKPENFDSTKKYPVIFNFYEKYSYEIYDFHYPGLTDGNINIPYFTSRGYLVFKPDIYYGVSRKTGITSAQYALISVESAADELKRRSYVDENRFGMQGHSFGGLETNYILTHSKKFAAASEGAGFADAMSNYLSVKGISIGTVDINSVQGIIERGHQLYGSTPWEVPQLYLNNSPIWSADKASCPLLIFHNKKDEQVPWRQGIEMYLALRRLGKPCWMLQYDNSGHGLSQFHKDALDYTIRLTQFYDHYLKGDPAPRWMTQGIPAKLKQVENRYELDPNGSCGKDCKICKEKNYTVSN